MRVACSAVSIPTRGPLLAVPVRLVWCCSDTVLLAGGVGGGSRASWGHSPCCLQGQALGFGGGGVGDGLSGGLFWIQQELFQKYQMFSDKNLSL